MTMLRHPTASLVRLGQNIVATRDGDILILRIDCSQRINDNPRIIATTNGCRTLPTGETIDLEFTEKPQYEETD